MHRAMPKRGWKSLLAVILIFCVLCAVTGAACHAHPSGEAPSHSHCGLCMVGIALVGIIVSVALSLIWRSTLLRIRLETQLFPRYRIISHSIRPPPHATCAI